MITSENEVAIPLPALWVFRGRNPSQITFSPAHIPEEPVLSTPTTIDTRYTKLTRSDVLSSLDSTKVGTPDVSKALNP